MKGSILCKGCGVAALIELEWVNGFLQAPVPDGWAEVVVTRGERTDAYAVCGPCAPFEEGLDEISIRRRPRSGEDTP